MRRFVLLNGLVCGGIGDQPAQEPAGYADRSFLRVEMAEVRPLKHKLDCCLYTSMLQSGMRQCTFTFKPLTLAASAFIK